MDNRLTKLYKAGRYGLMKVKDNEQEVDSPYPNTLRAILECFQQLGAYEDTGFLPAEVVAMREELERAKIKTNYAIQALERLAIDGRIGKYGVYSTLYDAINEITSIAPVTGIPASENRPLALDEVLALPEGAVGHVEWKSDDPPSVFDGLITRCAPDAKWLFSGYAAPREKDCRGYGKIFRVWSLPVAPTPEELAKNPWPDLSRET